MSGRLAQITSATEPLWGLVCGFAGRQRDRRWLLMPKAYIDDSGRLDHSPVFVLAGWAAPVATWIQFSEDWQAVLDDHPPLEYFKSTEAAHCRGQFDGFSEDRRDKRVRLFCDVLDKHLPLQVSCIVVLSDFERLIKSTSLPEWTHNPYYLAFWTLLTSFAQNQRIHGFTEPMDFVFDDQAEKTRIRNGWAEFLEHAPENIRPFIGIEPAFLDDKKVKPLQAADLMAYQVREWDAAQMTGNLKHLNTSLPLVQGSYNGLRIHLDEAHLRVLLGPALKGV